MVVGYSCKRSSSLHLYQFESDTGREAINYKRLFGEYSIKVVCWGLAPEAKVRILPAPLKIEHYETAGRISPSGLTNPTGKKTKKYSEGFNQIFSFFFKSYRYGLLNFAGEGVEVYFDINGPDGKQTIKNFENGYYTNNQKPKPILTRHPNIVKGFIVGKKSWGLHVKMWSEGIRDWCFTKEEILQDFYKKSIEIPKFLENDFDNWIRKYKSERY